MFIKLLCNSLCLRKESFHIKGHFRSRCLGPLHLLTSCKDHPILVTSSPRQPRACGEAVVASPTEGPPRPGTPWSKGACISLLVTDGPEGHSKVGGVLLEAIKLYRKALDRVCQALVMGT